MVQDAPYDLILRGGRVICSASDIDGTMDVGIREGRIAAVQPKILSSSAKEVIDVRDRLVLPGLIDTHAHCYRYVTGRFGLEADMVGVQSGVTTVVDIMWRKRPRPGSMLSCRPIWLAVSRVITIRSSIHRRASMSTPP